MTAIEVQVIITYRFSTLNLFQLKGNVVKQIKQVKDVQYKPWNPYLNRKQPNYHMSGFLQAARCLWCKLTRSLHQKRFHWTWNDQSKNAPCSFTLCNIHLHIFNASQLRKIAFNRSSVLCIYCALLCLWSLAEFLSHSSPPQVSTANSHMHFVLEHEVKEIQKQNVTFLHYQNKTPLL